MILSLDFRNNIILTASRENFPSAYAKIKRISVAKWFLRWTTKLEIRVRSRVAAGLPTGYLLLGGNLTEDCCQQYRPRLDNRGGNDTHRGLCWK